MNWTGGRLKRLSNAQGSLTNRQKEHFAKAQNRVSIGKAKRLPSSFDFDNSTHTRRPTDSLVGSPIAYRPEGPRLAAIKLELGHSPQQGSDYQRHTSPQAPQAVEDIGVRQHSGGTSQTIVYNGVPDDDLYNATPEPREVKVKREASTPAIDHAETEDEEEIAGREEESLIDKRRRLLRKGDWVGITMQKPVHLRFSGSKHSDDIGRRRKVTDGHRARYNSQQLASPLIRRNRLLLLGGSTSGESQITAPVRNDVRISIGGRVVPPGASSSSRYSKTPGHPGPRSHSPERSVAQSSDVMLLDDYTQGGVFASFQDHAPHNNEMERFGERSSVQGVANGHMYLRHHQYQQRDALEENLASPFQQANASSDPGTNPRMLGQMSTSVSSPNRRRSRSTSLPLHHPIPQRLSRLLPPASFEDIYSIIAQVGEAKPLVPSSQILDNEIWNTWLASSDADEEQDHGSLGDSGDHRAESISPGISTAPQYPALNGLTTSESSSMEEETLGPLSTEVMEAHRVAPRSSGSSSVSTTPRIVHTEQAIPEQLSELKSNEGLSPKLGASDRVNIPENIEMNDNKDDAEDLWRKFVFGDGSDEVSESPDWNAPMAPSHGDFSDVSAAGSDEAIDGQSEKTGPPQPQSNSTRDEHSTGSLAAARRPMLWSSSLRQGGSTPYVGSSSNDHSSNFDNQGNVSTPQRSGRPVHTSPTFSSVARVASSQLVNFTASENTPSSRPEKIIFTKPKPFLGSSVRNSSETSQEPLRIGRGLAEDRTRTRERVIYSSVSSDELEDELESIEDD